MDTSRCPSLGREVFYPSPRAPEPQPPTSTILVRKEQVDVMEPPHCIVCKKVGDVVGSGYPLSIPSNYEIPARVFSDKRGCHAAWGDVNNETYVTMSIPLVELLMLYHGHLAGPCGNEGVQR